jgi:hypothetical protein
MRFPSSREMLSTRRALRPKPANEVVASFEKMTSDLKVVRPEEVQHPEKFSPAHVDSVLGGLERIAQTSTSNFLSTSAAAALMDVGAAQKAPSGIFDRQNAFISQRDD